MRSTSLSILSFIVINNLFQLGSAQTPACFSTCETSGVVSSGCTSVADVACNCASQIFLTTTENCFTAQCDTAADAQTALQLLQNQCAAASVSSSSLSSSSLSLLSSSTTATASTTTRTLSTTTTTNPNLLTTTSSSTSSSTSIINTPDPNYTAPTRNVAPPGYTYTPPSQATSAAAGGGGAVAASTPLSSSAGKSRVQIALAVLSILAGAWLL